MINILSIKKIKTYAKLFTLILKKNKNYANGNLKSLCQN